VLVGIFDDYMQYCLWYVYGGNHSAIL